MLTHRVSSLLLAFAVAVLPALPAPHVHARTDAHGHRVLIVHRDVDRHTVGAREADGRAGIDDSDPTRSVLAASYTVTTRYGLRSPFIATTAVRQAPASRRVLAAGAFADHGSHAPPRSIASLRAPPALL